MTAADDERSQHNARGDDQAVASTKPSSEDDGEERSNDRELRAWPPRGLRLVPRFH
jgi:hypothetical protein